MAISPDQIKLVKTDQNGSKILVLKLGSNDSKCWETNNATNLKMVIFPDHIIKLVNFGQNNSKIWMF